MNRHHDLINLYANNKSTARHIVLEFLNSYKKKDILIIAVEGTDNHYEVEVQYSDDYKDCAEFNSNDFTLLTEKEVMSLKYTL